MKHHVRGFTLLELMVVVSIIGLMAAIALPAYSKFQCKAEQDEGKVAMAAMTKLAVSRREDLADWGTNTPGTLSVPCNGTFPQNPFGFALKGKSRYRYNLIINAPAADGTPSWTLQAFGCPGLPVAGDVITANSASGFPVQGVNACH